MSRSEQISFDRYCDCESVFIKADTSSQKMGGYDIIRTGYKMALVDKSIVRGSCWDFVNEVMRRSGYAHSQETVFKSKKTGPFAPSTTVQPGDWIYHINHQWKNVEHSAIFICWKDFAKRIAITLSYEGMNRNAPAKFGEYELNNIYNIIRPVRKEVL